MQCSNAEKYLFSMQMLYLKHGQTEEIDMLQLIYKTWVQEKKSLDIFYNEMNEYIRLNPARPDRQSPITKNMLALKQQLIKDFETRTLKVKSKSTLRNY
jgi:hypothetical protein